MRFLLPAAVTCAIMLATLASNCKADEAPDEKTGLKVGEKAPAFSLKDQNSKERSLAELLKEGPVALVFYRSAGW